MFVNFWFSFSLLILCSITANHTLMCDTYVSLCFGCEWKHNYKNWFDLHCSALVFSPCYHHTFRTWEIHEDALSDFISDRLNSIWICNINCNSAGCSTLHISRHRLTLATSLWRNKHRTEHIITRTIWTGFLHVHTVPYFWKTSLNKNI